MAIKIGYNLPSTSFKKFIREQLDGNNDYDDLHQYLIKNKGCLGGSRNYMSIIKALAHEYIPTDPKWKDSTKIGASKKVLEQASRAYLEYLIYHGY